MKMIPKILSMAGLAAGVLFLANCACASKSHCASCDKAAASKACAKCGKAQCACPPAKKM